MRRKRILVGIAVALLVLYLLARRRGSEDAEDAEDEVEDDVELAAEA